MEMVIHFFQNVFIKRKIFFYCNCFNLKKNSISIILTNFIKIINLIIKIDFLNRI